MATKKDATPQKPMKERAVAAALDLAGRMGWGVITMADIADKAHVSLAKLSDHFDDKSDILVAYGRMLDRRVLESVGSASPEENPRDRLFEILMERFDILNEDRDAIVSILSTFRLDPKELVLSLPHLGRSMSWMLEAAGIDTTGIKGAIRIAGATGVYLYAVKAWMKDEGEGLPKTMAALDKGLNRAEQAASTFAL